MTIGWFVVETRPAAEQRVAKRLEDQKFEVCLPLLERIIRHGRREELVRRPLFGRYLFTRLDPAEQRWRAINGTYEAIKIFSRDDNPTRMPERAINDILEKMDEHGIFRPPAPPDFEEGQKLQITGGSFIDRVGLYVAAKKDAAILLLDILGGRVEITVPISQVVAAS